MVIVILKIAQEMFSKGMAEQKEISLKGLFLFATLYSIASEKHLDTSNAVLYALGKSKQSISIMCFITTTNSILLSERDHLKDLY